MATHSTHPGHTGVLGHTRTRSRPLARAFLLAVLCSQLSTVAASPLPSLPASAPGFNSAAAVPAVPEAVSDPVVDNSPHIEPATSIADLDFLEAEDEIEDGWELEYEDAHQASDDDDGKMSVDGMGNAMEKTNESTPGSSSNLPPPPPPPPPPIIGPLTLPESLLASLSHLLSLGFWKGLLGSFLVFWVLIASTLALLLLVAIRVGRMDRNGRLKGWAVEMERGRDFGVERGVEEGRKGVCCHDGREAEAAAAEEVAEEGEISWRRVQWEDQSTI